MARPPLWRRYARLFGPDPKADVTDELQFHLDSKTDDLVAQGWAPEAARAEAGRQLGNMSALQATGERLGEQMEERRRRGDYTAGLLQDLRYALRTLRRDRGFTFVTVLILAIGIAANTAVFSVVNTLLLRPLPFTDAHQLAWLTSGRDITNDSRKTAGLSAVTYTVAVFQEFQRHNHSFQSVTAYNPFFGNSEYTMTGRGEPLHVTGVMVGDNFFQTLKVQPALGRLFVEEECRKGGPPAVLLSDGFWRRRFGGDRAIVGQAIALNKQAATVIGVLPASFDFGSVFSPGFTIDVYVPAVMDEMRTWGNTLSVIGRLKPGVTVAQAQAEADVLFPQMKAAHPEWYGDYASTILGLKDHVSGRLRRALIVLWCAVGLILLIVCVNVSNLLLARAITRSKEFALRAALGAGTSRLFRQLLTESAVLAGAGAIVGLGLAFAVTAYVSRQGSIALPLLSSVTVDRTALLWTLLITSVTALLFGSVPGLRLSSGNMQETLKSSGPGMTAGRSHERLRTFMVMSQVGLACVLLISAGLLLRSFLNVLDVDLGFQPEQAAVIKIDYAAGDGARRGVVLQEILRDITSIPGIESAGIADMLPLGRNRSWGFRAKDKAYAKGDNIVALVRIVTPGYLGAMGMRLKQGRDFSWRDASNGERVVVINEAAARLHWPGQDPVGRMALTTGNRGWEPTKVIGVISDVREHSLEASADPEMYLPAWQGAPEGAELVVRTKLTPAALDSDRHENATRAKSGPACDGTSSASAYRGSGCFAAAILCTAGHLLCRAGSGAGCARNLWHCLVFRDPTKAGDRHPNGARREYVAGPKTRDRACDAVGDCRRDHRNSVVFRRRQVDCVASVCDETHRSGDIPECFRPAGRRRPGGRICPGPAGVAD